MLGVFRCWHGQETVLAVYPTFEKASDACGQLIQLFQVDNGDFAAYGIKDMRDESLTMSSASQIMRLRFTRLNHLSFWSTSRD